jgi:hypothetical protein
MKAEARTADVDHDLSVTDDGFQQCLPRKMGAIE